MVELWLLFSFTNLVKCSEMEASGEEPDGSGEGRRIAGGGAVKDYRKTYVFCKCTYKG